MSDLSAPQVGLVIAAHAPLAGALADTALAILGQDAGLSFELVEISASDAPSASTLAVEEAVGRAERGAGVLVLADLFGGSAANVALSQLGEDRVEVVTGANLAMVLEAATHAMRGRGLAELATRAAEAARTSVVVAGALITPTGASERPHA